ncbi:MAG: protoglobin domain-containing protein [Cyanobacteria bacterium]|nr:protoglobin domain-containing protein [Cyanobacteriota bacterium]
MALDPRQFLARMTQRMGFSDADKQLLKSNAEWGLTIAPDMADAFYDYLGRDEEMSQILNATDGRIHRLRETFIEWFHEMFTGMDDWGDNYADRRWRIGLIHVRVGIGPQHVVPAMATVMAKVGDRLKTDDQADDLRDALSRSCMVDLAFIEQAYIEATSTAVLRETGWTEGLFRRLVATGAGAM